MRFAALREQAASRRGDLTHFYPTEDARREAVEEKDEMSTETKWTQGQLSLRIGEFNDDRSADAALGSITDADGNVLAEIWNDYECSADEEPISGIAPHGTALAFGRLFAASPRLYAALERSLDWLSSYPGGNAMAAYDEARAALAAARGEQ